MPKFLAVTIFTAVAALVVAGPAGAQMMSPAPWSTPTPTPPLEAPSPTPAPTPTPTPTATPTPEIIPPPVADPSQYQLDISVDPEEVEEEQKFKLSYTGAAPYSMIALKLIHDDEKVVHTFPSITVDKTGSGSVILTMPHVRDIASPKIEEADGFVLEGDNSPYSKDRAKIAVRHGGTPLEDKPIACTSGKQITISSDKVYVGGPFTVKISCAKPGSKVTLTWIHPDDKWIPIIGIPLKTIAVDGPITVKADGTAEMYYAKMPNFLKDIESSAKIDTFMLEVKSEWPDNNFIYDRFNVTLYVSKEEMMKDMPE